MSYSGKHNFLEKLFSVVFLFTCFYSSTAQKAPEKNWSSSRILHEIEKMKHVGRVLYIAAHPDDENTQLISYLANVKGIEVAYMSLTRGDGGQDLLGPEVRDELGVIRTQELLMARSIDGGEQFFSRANDFGFSKTANETLHIWDSNEVLSDIVWEIRHFKPDIIITRFSPTYAKTHGHHQASAILAQVAFDDAANPSKFPEQLKYTDTWQAKSLFWNTSTFFFQDSKLDTAGLYHTNIGAYIPLLGKSVGELAAESRTMHKSQGMGSTPRRGDIMEYFVYMKGDKPAGRDIFGGVNFNWNRIKGGEIISEELDKISSSFAMLHPEKSVEELIETHKKLEPSKDNYLIQSKLQQLDNIILQCEGVYAEAISIKEFLPVGDSIKAGLNILVQNSSNVKINFASIEILGRKVSSFADNISLKKNALNLFSTSTPIPDTTSISGPYWLEDEHTTGMYKVDNQLMRGLPQNPAQVVIHVEYSIGTGEHKLIIQKDLPVFYKFTDPTKGDVYSLARIVPPAVVTPQEKLLVFADNKPKAFDVKVKTFKKSWVGIKFNLPEGWDISIDTSKFSDSMVNRERAFQTKKGSGYRVGDFHEEAGSEESFTFYIHPPDKAQSANIDIYTEVDGHSYNRSMENITYEHIPEQLLLPKSKIKVVRMEIVTHPKLIGYINGAGDDVPDALKQMGYKVEMISPSQLDNADLSKYDAIIAGVRAYNTVDRLKYDNARLMNYVKNGGNYIVQYNNNFRLVIDSIGPYYLHPSKTRTTDEDCKITFLNTDNPALNKPNKITEKDFEGWVQERGLYYPDKWDTAHYTPLLEMNDLGEAPTKGALLMAQYGKGNFVYTGLVFFRELPAGVPGAYRLMANLIELEKH